MMEFGGTTLQTLLQQLSPQLLPECYHYLSLNDLPKGLDINHVFAMVKEKEGFTLILSEKGATHTLRVETDSIASKRFRCIALGVHSSLEAVGLTAAVSGALAKVGIPANIIAGYYHDYIFIPENDADKALETLNKL